MNHEPKKECFKTSVGGQALMEGIMMRGPEHICCAVRKPDGTIETKMEDTPKHGIWAKIPLVRGAISMIESLITGYHYMMYSAQVSMGDEYDAEEEESAFEKWVGDHLGKKAEDILMAGAALVGGLFAILLFTVLPTVLVGGLGKVVTLTRWPRVILEALLKVAIFLSYMVAISKMKEIHRVSRRRAQDHRLLRGRRRADRGECPQVHPFPPPLRHQLPHSGGHRQRFPLQRAALEQHQPPRPVQAAAPARRDGHQLRAAQVVRPLGQHRHPHHPPAPNAYHIYV